MKLTFRRALFSVLACIFIGVYLLPIKFTMPVKNAGRNSYNQSSFWYYPWGKSITHKGVDIFGKIGTPIVAASPGIVLFNGQLSLGGNCVLILGPKWRFYYYAHLQKSDCQLFDFINVAEPIGKLGDTGNAKGKPPHLHFTIFSLIPYFWKIDDSIQGWKKMFILNPIPQLNLVCN